MMRRRRSRQSRDFEVEFAEGLASLFDDAVVYRDARTGRLGVAVGPGEIE